ncbi:MFS transporter, partial [Mesorhizobium sp. M2C.T.Ca.TU.009.01.2.1]
PAWGAVVSLALGVFGLVTAEFLPASLLTRLAQDLGVSEGAAGQAVTATAVVGAIAAPTMAIVTKRLDRRLVMWILSVLLIVSNLLAAFASSLTMLLLARVVLGVALGGFWSMSAAMALRLVPMRLMPRAMSIILTGVSVATVTAAPVGAYVGDIWGWRTAFMIAAVVGALALLVQLATLPSLPPTAVASFRTLVDVLKRP